MVRIRHDAIYVISEAIDDNGLVLACLPAKSFDEDSLPRVVGEAVLDALSRFRKVASGSVSPANVPASLGLRSWNALERDATRVSIESEGEIARFTVFGAHGEGIQDEHQCRLVADEIGRMLRKLGHTSGRGRWRVDNRRGVTSRPNPELEYGIGSRSVWLAVKNSDPKDVAAELRLIGVKPAGWVAGLRAVSKGDAVFVVPAEGWVLAVGLPAPVDRLGALLNHVARRCSKFGTAYYFATHRVPEFHAWAVLHGMMVTRAFAYLGERDEIILDVGEPTELEVKLLLEAKPGPTTRSRIVRRLRPPREIDVLDVAAGWSIDVRIVEGSRGLLGKWSNPVAPVT